MAYSTKTKMKHERKLGMDAARHLEDFGITKHQALAYAKLSLDRWEQVDEYDDAQFCKTMEDWREHDPAAYAAFWWWRKAHEDNANSEEDPEREYTFRFFTITQFLAAPFDFDAWNDDRMTLKDGVEPWITEQQIKEGLEHRTIKRWAYIWHTRDIYTEEDEIKDREGLRIAGERKFTHAHILGEAPGKVSVAQLCRWFNVPPSQVKVLTGKGSFEDFLEYMFHLTPKAVEQNKTVYDWDEVVCTPGLDPEQIVTTSQRNRLRWGKRGAGMTAADTMRMHVLEDGWSLRDCRRDDPLTYTKISKTLPSLRLDYLLDAPSQPLRLNIYVDGDSGLGKSSFCEFLAQYLFVGHDAPYFTTGNDDRVTFDGYDGQPCIIFEEMRAIDFISRFKRAGALRLLDTHPKRQTQHVKGSKIILCNSVNIINGIEPYEQFLDGLAGRYTDKFGIQHEAEQDTQVYRRMPMIIRIREEDFDVLVNKGFVDNDLHAVKQYTAYAHVCGSMKNVMERLEGEAHTKVIGSLVSPIVDAVGYLQDAHDNKVSDPDAIPDEFSDYGNTAYGEDLAEDARQRIQRKIDEDEAEKVVALRLQWEELDDELRRYHPTIKRLGIYKQERDEVYPFHVWLGMTDEERREETDRVKRVTDILDAEIAKRSDAS